MHDLEEQEHTRVEDLDAQLKDLQELYRQAEEARQALEAERAEHQRKENAATENAAHGSSGAPAGESVAQRFKYHLQLKRENDALSAQVAELRKVRPRAANCWVGREGWGGAPR